MRFLTAALVLLGLAARRAPAQDAIASRLVQIVQPDATALAVSDRHDMLIVATPAAGAQLAVHRLAKDGALAAGDPQPLALPIPTALAKYKIIATGITFHPQLDVVYVWQDVIDPEPRPLPERRHGHPIPKVRPSEAEQLVYDNLDHLLVYAIKDGTLSHLGSYARGDAFAFGSSRAAVAVAAPDEPVDPNAPVAEQLGGRIYLPNMRDTETGQAAVGYFELRGDGTPAPRPVPIPGSLDGRGLEQFEMKVAPVAVMVPSVDEHHADFGFAAATMRTVLLGSQQSMTLWDTVNRRAAFGVYSVHHATTVQLLAGAPALGRVYGAGLGHSLVWNMQHVQGYPTMLIQRLSINTKFSSRPVIATGEPRAMIVGASDTIFAIPLDPAGRFTGGEQRLDVASPSVRFLAYSDKYNKIYVTVEKTP